MFTFLRVLVVLMCAMFLAVSIQALVHGTGNTTIHVVNIFLQALLGTINAYYIFAERNVIPFSVRLKLAETVIAQVKAGEWKPEENQFQTQVYNLMRNGQKMWIASGAWFLRIDNENLFGNTLKHYVWHKAVKQVVAEANKQYVWHKAVKQVVAEANKQYNASAKTIATANRVLGEKPTLKVVK